MIYGQTGKAKKQERSGSWQNACAPLLGNGSSWEAKRLVTNTLACHGLCPGRLIVIWYLNPYNGFIPLLTDLFESVRLSSFVSSRLGNFTVRSRSLAEDRLKSLLWSIAIF
ncbi:hypothetical protein TWF106_010269 [Orbilia oligospora]|uniref:Uncharacterized protein n=1 Tax=Orbilia oligospora TaxID=2813651 RepID=A0A6G1MBQ5_ORBOL|nr:hypothetical protein TWF788_010805 [Orbilia oligospora]KAF3203731.1 hypothetical protein TWF679_010084 [Orbilia oligospora]KAF3211385.1 hypothetical protein TWF106_010269 [Orbilia oligospora]KAF3219215.1 hypothetical protein TWF191_008008 [Orbilia oligospora]KAF3251809.1 hypothetical protein TWF192_004767 [Orbilia oligospora]